MKKIAITQRVDFYPERNEERDALDQKLIEFTVACGFYPVLIPNTLDHILIDWLKALHVDGLVLSGGNNIGEVITRDATEQALLDFAFLNKIPVLGICRGMQMMGVWAGSEMHKVEGHVATRHELKGVISKEVNSFHDFSISICPSGFDVLAVAHDGRLRRSDIQNCLLRVGCGIRSVKILFVEKTLCVLRICSMDELLPVAKAAARAAGIEILKYYKQEVPVLNKTDGSPLTLADKAAHVAICQKLSTSNIMVVSEEGDDLHLDAIEYWLVDPLDGTKDFLASNDEFTVNVALIRNGEPILGVIYAPALDQLYWGLDGVGSGLESKGTSSEIIPLPNASQLKMAISRFHDHEEVSKFGDDNGVCIRVPVGSALKYGLLATGEVDVFPRLVGSSEWDVAAGHSILKACGGAVLDWHTGEPLEYGKENRRNPRLISF